MSTELKKSVVTVTDTKVDDALDNDGKRKKIQCPVCKDKVKDVNRHLISKHNAKNREDAKRIRSQHGAALKDKRVLRVCPKCNKSVGRLDKHLAIVHSKDYPKNSIQYKLALKNAQVFNVLRPVETVAENGEPSTSKEMEHENISEVEKNVITSPTEVTEEHDDSHSKEELNTTPDVYMTEAHPENLIVLNENENLGQQEDVLMEDDDDYDLNEESEFAKPLSWANSSSSNIPIESALGQFWKHLQRPEGGLKKTEYDADQVTNRVYRLVNALSEKTGRRLTIEVFRQSNEIWDYFVASKEGKAGTLKMRTKYHYILSLEKFLNFVLNCRNTLNILYEVETDLKHTYAAISGWKTALKPALKKERVEKQAEKYETQLTVKEVQDMVSSEAFGQDQLFVNTFKPNPGKCISLYDHNRARDFVIFKIIHRNAQRSGIARGMMSSEFLNAQYRQDKDRYVILVKDHKTALDGPAPIVLTPEEYNLMKKYYENFRPSAVQEQDTDCGVFFLTRRGTQLNSCRVSEVFDILGRKYGRTGKGRLFPTKFRQTAATTVARKSQQMKEDLSHLMSHKQSTQKEYYVLEDTIDRAIDAHEELSSSFLPPVKGRPSRTDDEVDTEIKKIFEGEIKQRSLITIGTVLSKKESSDVLKHEDTRKLVKRIRYLSSKEPMPELPAIEEESLQEKIMSWNNDPGNKDDDDDDDNSTNIVPPSIDESTSTAKKRRYWSIKDEETVLRACSSLFKKGTRLPRTFEIKDLIKTSKDEDFQMLVLALGKTATERILTKAKTMHLSMTRKNTLLKN